MHLPVLFWTISRTGRLNTHGGTQDNKTVDGITPIHVSHDCFHSEGGPVIATGPDLLRLAIIPVFVWLAIVDIRTRRIPRWVWWPLGAVGLIALGWAALGTAGIERRIWTIQVAFSLGLIGPLGYLFYRFGAFGAADAKAIIVIAIAYPTYPIIDLGSRSLPYLEMTMGVFSLTVLVNAVLLGLVYPFALAARNGVTGHLRSAMFVGRPVPTSTLPERHGVLLDHRGFLPRSGLDLDALRMYLRWRNTTIEAIRADPARFQDPTTVPSEPGPVDDGAIRTDGGEEPMDRWAARAFLDDVGSAYGTRPEELRFWLDQLAKEDVLWMSPGIPFLVLLAGGLVVGVLVGDLFTWIGVRIWM